MKNVIKIAFCTASLLLAGGANSYVMAEESVPNVEEAVVCENPGARNVLHYTFSGTPGETGTGVNGDVWDGTHYFLPDGQLATECFFCDGYYTYYLQNDGTPMTRRLTYHPDGEHIIYFDVYGHEVFNSKAFVSNSITGEKINKEYYFDVYGFMYIDQLTFLEGKDQPSYFDYSGARLTDGQYVLPNGDYVLADKNGNLCYNTFTYDAFGRIVYCNWNGSFAKGTVCDNNFTYVFDDTDGHLLNYYPKENCCSDAVPFESLLLYIDELSMQKGAAFYEMRLLGDNDITNSIINWNGSETLIDYMNAIDDEYWKLSIYKDVNGNIINDLTGAAGTYATLRGVTIGTKKNDVRACYGTPLYEGQNGTKWDWYGTYWTKSSKYSVSWKEDYCVEHYGIRFYYDENDNVSKIVYQKYPMLYGINNNEPIMLDVQDITPYYVRRDFVSFSFNENNQAKLDASVSKYANEKCTYQWYQLKPTEVNTHNGDEIEKIQGACDCSFIMDKSLYPSGVYCRITNSDGNLYDVFFKAE